MEIRISDELIDDVVDEILYRMQQGGRVFCRRCDKRLAWEDAFCLCVSCQEDIGENRLDKFIKIKKKKKNV